jgi:DNA-binding LacI/PurR family transcriptional regulator
MSHEMHNELVQSMSKTQPTTKDVARLAGVSIATVSYVLNEHSRKNAVISEATRQRVLDAVAELGYVPNQVARNLRLQRTERISVVFSRMGAPSNDVLLRDIQQVADIHGYTVIISIASTPEREQQTLNQLKRHLADGAIIVQGPWQTDDLAELAHSGLPLVTMHNHVVGQEFDVVQTTETETCYEAVCYLLSKGHHRIAFLGHFEHLDDRQGHYDRFSAYLRALQDHHIPIDEQLIRSGATSRQYAYQSVLELLQLSKPPDAIFAASDIAAISSIWAVRNVGLRIPEDVAIIGIGNIPEGQITDPPLTTVGLADPNFTILADLLFSRLANTSLEGRVHTLQWQLILRASA